MKPITIEATIIGNKEVTQHTPSTTTFPDPAALLDWIEKMNKKGYAVLINRVHR